MALGEKSPSLPAVTLALTFFIGCSTEPPDEIWWQPGYAAAQFAADNGAPSIDQRQVDAAATEALEPFERHEADGSGRGRLKNVRFVALPTRPMVQVDLPARRLEAQGPASILKTIVTRQHPESVVRLKICGRPAEACLSRWRTAEVRRHVPPTMNLSVRLAADPTFRIET